MCLLSKELRLKDNEGLKNLKELELSTLALYVAYSMLDTTVDFCFILGFKPLLAIVEGQAIQLFATFLQCVV